MRCEDPGSFSKQVDSSQYEFIRYVDQARWASIWHQIDEITSAEPTSVLEIGKGSGLLGAVLKHYGIQYESVDIDPGLEPDHVASVTELPFEANSFDVVGCFQVLEHIPYKHFRQAITELVRVSRKKVVISLPDAEELWQYRLHIPFLGVFSLDIPRPRLRPRPHVFDGEHYWEINKSGYPLDDILNAIESSGTVVVKSYRVIQNPFHRFFVLEAANRELAS